jgi:hypothetical protein
MDLATIATVISTVTGIGGGFLGGRRAARQEAKSMADSTISMLSARMDVVEKWSSEKDVKIVDMTQKIKVLEDLVLQRAKVDDLIIVTRRIAEALGVSSEA